MEYDGICHIFPQLRVELRYVLIMYTEDQAAQNDGKLSDPIYFQVEVSNGFIIEPSLVPWPYLAIPGLLGSP